MTEEKRPDFIEKWSYMRAKGMIDEAEFRASGDPASSREPADAGLALSHQCRDRSQMEEALLRLRMR
jgi:hypothetical protein